MRNFESNMDDRGERIKEIKTDIDRIADKLSGQGVIEGEEEDSYADRIRVNFEGYFNAVGTALDGNREDVAEDMLKAAENAVMQADHFLRIGNMTLADLTLSLCLATSNMKLASTLAKLIHTKLDKYGKQKYSNN